MVENSEAIHQNKLYLVIETIRPPTSRIPNPQHRQHEAKGTVMSPHPRYRPLQPPEWPPEAEHLRDSFAGKLNVYKTMAHHPSLLNSWTDLRQHIVLESALGPEFLEIAILRIGARLECGYEWAHHVSRAQAIGLQNTRIQSVAGSVDMMQQEDAIIATAVDELIDRSKLSSDTLDALEDLVGKMGVLDLIATLGFYKTLACIALSFSPPLDAGIDPQDIPNQ